MKTCNFGTIFRQNIPLVLLQNLPWVFDNCGLTLSVKVALVLFRHLWWYRRDRQDSSWQSETDWSWLEGNVRTRKIYWCLLVSSRLPACSSSQPCLNLQQTTDVSSQQAYLSVRGRIWSDTTIIHTVVISGDCQRYFYYCSDIVIAVWLLQYCCDGFITITVIIVIIWNGE